MAGSSYTFIQGNAILVGQHGQTDYVFESGEPVTNEGESNVVFESGTGLGGGEIIMEGEAVEPWRSAESPSSFMARDGAEVPQAQGFHNASPPIDDKWDDNSTVYEYVFTHVDTRNSSWSIGLWSVQNIRTRHSHRVDLTDLGNVSIVAEDDPNEGYGTNSNGDPFAEWAYNPDQADGGMWELPSGGYTITIEMSSGPESEPSPDIWRGRGSDGTSIEKAAGFGTSFTVEVNI